jgi:phosphatidylserine/phosphatidylglycerophosphate/cardiolipin synthase-like enzyme
MCLQGWADMFLAELLIALARALGNMSRSKTPNPRPGKKEFQKDSKGIYIVLSTNKEDGSEKEWEDRTSIKELMERLTIIMNNLPTEHGGIPSKDIPNVLKTMIHFKRTGTDKDVTGADLYSHSKLVCVDRKVMYVGSDNAYPSYNEEHGVWIEDQKTIDTWLDGFFTGYWNKLQDPFDV